MIAALIPLYIPVKQTDLTFVRHGETVANATGKYNSRTLNTFSEKGKQGVAALTERLKKQAKFDLILVSPSERALRTIAPYLAATRQKATVWPLLYECCTGPKQAEAKGPLKFSGKIKIPEDIARYFVITPGMDELPVAPDYGHGLVQVRESIREFKAHYQGRLLLVGHSAHGGKFLFGLTGKHFKVDNTKEIKVSLN